MVSANFVIPYPPGFPIMVPGQVLTQETIDFMRKLDVKEIHGYDATEGLKLVRPEALAKMSGRQPAASTEAEDCRRQSRNGGTNMQGFFTFLQQNPYLLLNFVAGKQSCNVITEARDFFSKQRSISFSAQLLGGAHL